MGELQEEGEYLHVLAVGEKSVRFLSDQSRIKMCNALISIDQLEHRKCVGWIVIARGWMLNASVTK